MFQVIIRKQPWPKGEVPPPLRPYLGQIKECPIRCKGKKGQDYRMCLKACAREIIASKDQED